MNYKMYKIHHSRGKSDTNFYQELNLLNGAYSSLKVLRVSIVNDLGSSNRQTIKKSLTKNYKVNSSKINRMKTSKIKENKYNKINDGEGLLTLIERIFLFKQEFDIYFFENKLQCLKFHLDNISSIIIKNINDLQNELISECPILKNSRLIKYLQNFADVISTLIETKPQDLYREIKDAILNQWEINRISIKELFDKIEIGCNNFISKDTNYFDISLIQDEIFNIKKYKYNNDKDRSSEDDQSVNRLKKYAPYVLKYLLKKKKEINYFISMMTQGILFTISKLYYDMDYYSIIISSLAFKIFYGIMYFIDENKGKYELLSDKERSRQHKVYHIIAHFINLASAFNKNIKAGIITSDNGGLNSMSKFILNNFIEIIPKCDVIKDPKLIQKFDGYTLFQTSFKTKFYKCYLQRYKKYIDNSLLRIFMLYYNSKMIFWKSVMIEAKSKDNNKNFTCRTCENEIPLEDIFLHLGCCKEQQSFYDKMKGFKSKLERYITSLFFYLEKVNLGVIKSNENVFIILNNIINKNCENKDKGIDIIKNLINLYSYEVSKDNDYYEKKPEEINYIVSMSYFSLIIFLLNKFSNEPNQELNEIFGGIFCTLLQIMINIYFLSYIKISKAKNSIAKGKKKIFERRKSKNNTITPFYNQNNINFILDNNKQLVNNDYLDINNINNNNNSNEELKSENKTIFNNIERDILSSEFDFKNEIKKYKSKLSLNNSLLGNNNLLNSSFNSKLNTRRRGYTFFKSSKNILAKNYSKQSTNENNNNLINNYNKAINITNNRDVKVIKINKNYRKSKSIFTDIKSKKNLLYLNDKIEEKPEKAKMLKKYKTSENIFFDYKSNIKKDKHGSNASKSIFHQINSNNNIILTEREYYKNNNSNNKIKNKINTKKYDNNISIYEEMEKNSNLFDSENISYEIKSSNNKNNNNITKRNNNKSQHNINNNIKNNNNNIYNKKLSLFNSRLSEKNSKLNKKDNYEKIQNWNLDTSRKNYKKDKKDKENSEDEKDHFENSSGDESSFENIIENEEKNSKKQKDETNNKIFSSFSDSKESNDNNEEEEKEEEERNIIIGEKESDSNLTIFLFLDPETKRNINEEQIPILYKELLEGIDKNFEKNFMNSLNLKKNAFPKLDEFNDEVSKNNLLKRKRLDSADLQHISLNSTFFKIKNGNNVYNSIKDNKDIYTVEIENNNEKMETQNEIKDKKVSKFKLILPIAKGGYGSVGLYKKTTTSDTYAIKTVDINCMKEKNLSSSLKNEQNILKEINNDYVVNSYYIFQDKKNYYFVMEYLPGGDVYTLLSKHNLPKKTIQLIVAETILAVNYLHSIRILHHDIKPENILISLKGHFKLSDFGLSKTLPENGDFKDEESYIKNIKDFVEFKKFDVIVREEDDENKEAIGTLNYMAPELFTDKYPHGSGIDYWSIGVLIFDLYSFSLPFEGKNQEETKNNIIGLKIDWNKLINDNVKKLYGNYDSAIDLIKKFLKENPAERWGDRNLEEIKKHNFFEGFNWNDIQNIKNETIKEYVKQRVKENNNKIKEINLKKKEKSENKDNKEDKNEDGYPSIIEINLTENEEKYFFTERLDNLNKKNNEIIKKKITKQNNIEGNLSNLMLLDLE